MVDTEQKQKQKKKIDYSKHPNYDEVCKKMRKLLGAAADFIPDACEALRQDWYPEVLQEQVKHDNEARNDIREQIFNDWSKERNTTQGAWADNHIQFSLPDWLRNPNQQTADYLEKSVAAMIKGNKEWRKSRLSFIENQEQKPARERLVSKLPEPINLPEPKSEETEPVAYEEDESNLPEVMRSIGDTGKDLMTLFAEINDPAKNLWYGLLGKQDIPGRDEDLEHDYIKPTRQFRKSLILELKNQNTLSLNALQRNLAQVDHIVGDMLDLIEKETEK